MAELVHQTWQRITGKPWSEAKKMGLTDGSSAKNIELQKRLNSGFNPYAAPAPAAPPPQAAPPTAAAPAPVAADPTKPYQDLIKQWYTFKPATPPTFNYAPEQAASDKRAVTEEYRPFYQEQATQSGQDFVTTLARAREGFSRRGLWGAAGGTTNATDANGLTTTNLGAPAPAAGPASGVRQRGEADLSRFQDQNNTAFGRAYTAAIAQGAQTRQAQAKDVYDKTVQDPYKEAYDTWLTSLSGMRV